MNTQQHLLIILGEESSELALACSKALRFGLDDIEPGKTETNRERLQQEFADVIATYGLLVAANWLPSPTVDQVAAKTKRVAMFMDYSQRLGLLNPPCPTCNCAGSINGSCL